LRSAIAPPSTRPLVAITAVKICNRMMFSSSNAVSPVKGPPPVSVPHTAMHEMVALTSAAPGCANRRPAQMTRGKTANSSGCRPASGVSGKTNTISDATMAAPSSAAASPRRPATPSRRHNHDEVSRTGATSSAPVASPSHQIDQSRPKRAHGCRPAAHNVVTPTVALTTVLPTAAAATKPVT
jgi:hypothetical protein